MDVKATKDGTTHVKLKKDELRTLKQATALLRVISRNVDGYGELQEGMVRLLAAIDEETGILPVTEK